jgi:hypothetical protein
MVRDLRALAEYQASIVPAVEIGMAKSAALQHRARCRKVLTLWRQVRKSKSCV